MFTDRQRKIFNELIKNPIVTEVTRTHDLGTEMSAKQMKLKVLEIKPMFEDEHKYLLKEYDDIMKLDLSNDFSNSLYSVRDKFEKLGFTEHTISPNEFEYILNETEKILNKEKEKNDNLIVRMNNWLDRTNNFFNLYEV